MARAAKHLRVGAVIEVLWRLEGRGKLQDVWWRDTVLQTCFWGRVQGVIVTAIIEYEQSFGFAESSDTVQLLEGEPLVRKR
jgi:hypothetical protein